jgi:DNA-binding PadR family transcriptional regulator
MIYGGLNMDIEKLIKAYMPMSESAYYILLALFEPCHGYGVILKVEKLTQGRIRLGAGTIYGTLSKFERDSVIEAIGEEDRKKIYKLTESGKELLMKEYMRICELQNNGSSILGVL